MTTDTISGFYGSDNTPCEVFVYIDGFTTWYCVEDSKNINQTHEKLEDGVDVELVEDIDTMTARNNIMSEGELADQFDDVATIQEFILTIDEFSHDAMQDDKNAEVIRILKGVISNIENNGLLNCDGIHLRDSNGNKVGVASVEVY